MIVYNLTPGGYASNCYVVVSEDQKESLLVDPSMSPARFSEVCPDVPMPTKILITHAHFDHIYAVPKWYALGATVYLNAKEVIFLDDPLLNCSEFIYESYVFDVKTTSIAEGDVIPIGEEELVVMETPGHTRGSCCFYGGGVIFTGDTLFAGGSIGRTDLPTGTYPEMRQSVKRLLTLPRETIVYPGHMQPTTIAQELKAHCYE